MLLLPHLEVELFVKLVDGLAVRELVDSSLEGVEISANPVRNGLLDLGVGF